MTVAYQRRFIFITYTEREESAYSLAATVSNLRIIDGAIAGDLPVQLNKLNFLIELVVRVRLILDYIYIRFIER